MKKVSLRDFKTTPPTDGVSINGQNALLLSSGLKQGDVIVAIQGTLVHNFDQYLYIRGSLVTPELDLIVWQGNAFHEIKASPPDHRFGVDFGDFKAN
jgi:hypothetical protein